MREIEQKCREREGKRAMLGTSHAVRSGQQRKLSFMVGWQPCERHTGSQAYSLPFHHLLLLPPKHTHLHISSPNIATIATPKLANHVYIYISLGMLLDAMNIYISTVSLCM
uniref:Uncharacterized protein n=1 Tax=Oryza brachyantha TaxID=4533 RepID=J3MII5_ORYBR